MTAPTKCVILHAFKTYTNLVRLSLFLLSFQPQLLNLLAATNIFFHLQDPRRLSFVQHPLNAYRLLRHVAVGWGVVEAGLGADLRRRGGDGGTRLNRVLRRRHTRHVPDEPDVDGVAKGIVRQEH
jgi:hypothetical protein